MRHTSHLIPVSLHLLTPCTIALILGIWWQAYYFWQFAALLWLLAATVCAIRFNSYLPQLCIVACFFFVGSVLYFRQQHRFATFQQLTYGQVFDVQGTVLEVEPIHKNWMRQMIKIAVTKMRQEHDAAWKNVDGVIQLYMYGYLPVHVDDVVEFFQLTFKPAKKESFSSYLIKEGIDATLFLMRADYALLERPEHSFWRSLARKRQQIFEQCKKKLSASAFALFSVIFLGNKNIDKNYVEDQQIFFKMWGISHHLARSGLHLILLLFMFQFFLRFIPVPFMAKQIFLLCVVGVYSLLSWASISYLRALITFLFYTLCNVFMVPIQLVHLVSLATFVVLIFNPSQLFFLDFQLSFGLTFALAWLSHVQKHRRVIEG